jgi:hypothetical protein
MDSLYLFRTFAKVAPLEHFEPRDEDEVSVVLPDPGYRLA